MAMTWSAVSASGWTNMHMTRVLPQAASTFTLWTIKNWTPPALPASHRGWLGASDAAWVGPVAASDDISLCDTVLKVRTFAGTPVIKATAPTLGKFPN